MAFNILDFLASENIIINSVPGGHNLPIYDAIEKHSQCKLVTWRTEYGAGCGALGIIRATANPSIIVTTAGPGITSLVSPVTEAFVESLPLIAIGVTNFSNALDKWVGTIHEISDSRPLFSSITAESIRITSAQQFNEKICAIVKRMKDGLAKPIYLEVPSEIFSSVFEPISTLPKIGHQRLTIEPHEIVKFAEEIIVSLKNSKLPIFLIGWGVELSGMGTKICSLAKKIGACIVTTTKGRCAIPDNFSLNLGCVWDRDRAVAFEKLAQKSDFVLALGTSLSGLNTQFGKFPLPRDTFHVSSAPVVLNQNYPNSKTICTTIQEFIKVFDSMLSDEVYDKRIKRVEAICGEMKLKWSEQFNKTVPGIAKLIDSLRSAYDQDAHFVFDMSQEAYWLQRYLPFNSPFSMQVSFYFGSLGIGIPSAIGAAIGGKENVVCITGDGGFSYGLSEISTALKENVPLKIILFNNNCFGIIKKFHNLRFQSMPSGYDLINPDYKMLAQAFGLAYFRTTNHELRTTIDSANRSTNQYIIEVQSEDIPVFNQIKWPSVEIEFINNRE